MSVGFFIDPVFYKVGSGDFMNSFFSTVYIKLENLKWGSKYPIIMNNLYSGKIQKDDISKAKHEIEDIEYCFSMLSPKEIIWDFEDANALPPWGDNISPHITDLSKYFITSDGENLFNTFQKAFNASEELEEDLILRSI